MINYILLGILEFLFSLLKLFKIEYLYRTLLLLFFKFYNFIFIIIKWKHPLFKSTLRSGINFNYINFFFLKKLDKFIENPCFLSFFIYFTIVLVFTHLGFSVLYWYFILIYFLLFLLSFKFLNFTIFTLQ